MAELYEKCLRVGLRMTLPRKIILEVIEAADEHNIAMMFTGIRHFRH